MIKPNIFLIFLSLIFINQALAQDTIQLLPATIPGAANSQAAPHNPLKITDSNSDTDIKPAKSVQFTPYSIPVTTNPTDTSMDDVLIDRNHIPAPTIQNEPIDNQPQIIRKPQAPIVEINGTIAQDQLSDKVSTQIPINAPIDEKNNIQNNQPQTAKSDIANIAEDVDTDDVMLQRSPLSAPEFVLLTKALLEVTKLDLFFTHTYCQKAIGNQPELGKIQNHAVTDYRLNNCLTNAQDIYNGAYQENAGNIYNAHFSNQTGNEVFLIDFPNLPIYDQHSLKTFELKNGMVSFNMFKINLTTMTTSVVGDDGNYSIQLSGILNYNQKNYYFKTSHPIVMANGQILSGNIHILNNGRVIVTPKSFNVWDGDNSITYNKK